MSNVVTDARRPPFCFQTHDALDAIRLRFDGPRRSTALAIYLSLTETANRNGGAEARDGFRASRKEIAERAGVSVDTLDRYAGAFETLGLLAVERERIGTVNLPNLWTLTEAADPSRTGAPPSRTGAATPSRTGAAPKTLVRKDLEEVDIAGDRVPKKVDRKPVTPVERDVAVAVLAEWNRQTGQTLSSGDWLSKIVMRIREYPDLDADGHAAVIAAALSRPWWKGNPSPAVVYGNGAIFEKSLVDRHLPAVVEPSRALETPTGAQTATSLLREAAELREQGR